MKQILLVDDVDTTRDAYAQLLEWAGYSALLAGNGLEACEIAEARMPDLIVMDLDMPVLSGWEAARRIKGDSRTAHIPLIAVSARVCGDEDRRRVAECGFTDVWTKPLAPRRLLEAIRERLDPGAQAA